MSSSHQIKSSFFGLFSLSYSHPYVLLLLSGLSLRRREGGEAILQHHPPHDPVRGRPSRPQFELSHPLLPEHLGPPHDVEPGPLGLKEEGSVIRLVIDVEHHRPLRPRRLRSVHQPPRDLEPRRGGQSRDDRRGDIDVGQEQRVAQRGSSPLGGGFVQRRNRDSAERFGQFPGLGGRPVPIHPIQSQFSSGVGGRPRRAPPAQDEGDSPPFPADAIGGGGGLGLGTQPPLERTVNAPPVGVVPPQPPLPRIVVPHYDHRVHRPDVRDAVGQFVHERHDILLVRDGHAESAEIVAVPKVRPDQLGDVLHVEQIVGMGKLRGREGRPVHRGADRVGDVVAQYAELEGLDPAHDQPCRHDLVRGELTGRRHEREGLVSDGGESRVQYPRILPRLPQQERDVGDDGPAGRAAEALREESRVEGHGVLGIVVHAQHDLGAVGASVEVTLAVESDGLLHGRFSADDVMGAEDLGGVPFLGEGEQGVGLSRIPRRFDVAHLDAGT
mmetsp:Transcript_36407/g.109302  ORF Transcript_36407/g.109302 Transcript_36407/m.109302 type:complete len:498 (-) Transcript_36407:1485-2978(-)